MCRINRSTLTRRLFCGIVAVAVIISCVALLIILCFRKCLYRLDLYEEIYLGVACFTLLAAICLLFGSIYQIRILVWIWILIVVAVTITVTSVEIIRLYRDWNYFSDLSRTYKIIFLIIFAFSMLCLVYETIMYALNVKKSEEEQSRTDCDLRRC